MHHVASAHGPGTRGRVHHETPRVVDGARPARDLLAGQAHPYLLAQGAAAAADLVGQGPPPVGSFEQGTARAKGVQEAVEEDPAVHRLRRPAGLVQAGAFCLGWAGPGHVEPDAHNDSGQRGPGELRLGQDAGELRPVEQQVVGPFEDRGDSSHLLAGIGTRQGHCPGAQVHIVGAADRPEKDRGQQICPRR